MMRSSSRPENAGKRLLAIALCALATGCGVRTMPWLGGDAGSDTDTNPDLGLSSVDLLLVIDDSQSMSQEQTDLATDLFAFVASLVSPLPTSSYAGIDDLRVAVVTSNLGFSSNGVNNDGAWPWTVPSECQAFGDDGVFQGIKAVSVEVANDFVPCDESAAQCPPGWACLYLDGDGVGVCHNSTDTTVGCPSQGQGDPWFGSSLEAPDPNLPTRVACLSVQGTHGCGFEQQLASPVTALERDDQSGFARDDALLALLVVSDEEDCSMKDGAALFAESEIMDFDGLKVNIACGAHPEHLYSPAHFYEELVSIKQQGAVFFAAIVGVPAGGQGAAACQGFGDALGACLAQDEMQLTAEQPYGPADTTWYYRPACIREVGGDVVTKAYPGRRYVELANQSFGGMSYVCSICDADWSPAFETIGEKLAALVQ